MTASYPLVDFSASGRLARCKQRLATLALRARLWLETDVALLPEMGMTRVGRSTFLRFGRLAVQISISKPRHAPALDRETVNLSRGKIAKRYRTFVRMPGEEA